MSSRPKGLPGKPSILEREDDIQATKNEYRDPESWEENLRSPAKTSKPIIPYKSKSPYKPTITTVDELKGEEKSKFVPQKKPKVPTVAELGLTPLSPRL